MFELGKGILTTILAVLGASVSVLIVCIFLVYATLAILDDWRYNKQHYTPPDEE
jgi:hypothetical protein